MGTEGARRVEQRWDPSQNGQIVPDDKTIGRKLADDAMFKLEHERKDKDKSSDAAPRISQLSQIQDRVKDDWLANKMLRDQFRAKKKERKAQLEKDKLITGKCGLELDLVTEEEEDVRMARLLNVQSKTDADKKKSDERGDISTGDIFAAKNTTDEKESTSTKKLHALKTIGKATKSKQADLLLKKGFGIIVNNSNSKEKFIESLKKIATVTNTTTAPTSIISSSTPSHSITSSPKSPSESSTSLSTSTVESANNSLSKLFSQYDSNSDDSD